MDMDIQQARNASLSFFHGSQRCFEQRLTGPNKIEVPLIPAIVCGLFSIELAFKAVALRGGLELTGHNLLKLFNSLSPDIRARLIHDVALDEQTFIRALSEIADGFVTWRYIYEDLSKAKMDLGFLRKLAQAAQTSLTNAFAA